MSFFLTLGLTLFLHEGLRAPEELAFAVGLGSALVVNFFSCRHLIFVNAASGDARRQFILFVGSSFTFRGGEYVAFLLIHTVGGLDFMVAILGILLTSMLVKFFYYRTVVFPASKERPSDRWTWLY